MLLPQKHKKRKIFSTTVTVTDADKLNFQHNNVTGILFGKAAVSKTIIIRLSIVLSQIMAAVHTTTKNIFKYQFNYNQTPKYFWFTAKLLRTLNISQSCSYLSWQHLFSVLLATPDPLQSVALESLLDSKIKGMRCFSKIPTGFITTPYYMAVFSMLRQNWCRKNSSTFPGRFLPDDSTGWDDGFKVTWA